MGAQLLGLLNPVSIALTLLGRFIKATGPTPLGHPNRFGNQPMALPPAPTGSQGAQFAGLASSHD
jgi:hypothetical protein